MNKGNLDRVLVAPVVSEKSMAAAEQSRQHVFMVAPRATRHAVRAAVEKMFEVEVVRVNIINVKGKKKGFGRRKGRRKDWKKAYVRLREGFDIQLGGE